jgi:dethiobiotin synthetase
LPFAAWVANQIDPDFAYHTENIATLARRLPAPCLESVAFDASAHAFTSVTPARLLEAAFGAG